MTTEDAIRRLKGSVGTSPDTVAIRVVLAALAEAQRERDAVLAELRRLEWKSGYGEPFCPDCFGIDVGGHKLNCRLATFLFEFDTKGGPDGD